MNSRRNIAARLIRTLREQAAAGVPLTKAQREKLVNYRATLRGR